MTRLLCITILMMVGAANALSEEATPVSSFSVKYIVELGSNVTLPCRLMSKEASSFNIGIRVKWTKVAEDESLNEDVLLSMGFHKKTYGSFQDRVYLQENDTEDASLVITEVSKDDTGKYRCEIINGMEDNIQEYELEVKDGEVVGVVFPYAPYMGRYNMNYHEAVQACLDQDAVIATYEQLYEAWKGGLDWCNAGWLADASVKYPITKPRDPCGGANSEPGVRTYGIRDKMVGRFDVFCYATPLKGRFYWLVQPDRLTFDEAVQACIDDGAEIAKVGHMYAAWKTENYDRCDAGWLADGSVRYPISRPRKNCSPTEAAVRFHGFPDKTVKSYGVYCYKDEQ